MGGAAKLLRELRRHVSDERVLTAMREVPREAFVAPESEHDAWANIPLPIGAGQTISQPLVVARMCALLRLRGDERVLDVGTGSGYHAAILARLAAHVWSIERHKTLSAAAAENLARAGAENVTLIVGDGCRGLPGVAPFDAINVAAAAAEGIPRELMCQLAPAGRLVGPVGEGESQALVLIRRTEEGGFERERLERVRFVPLVEGLPD